MTEKNSNPATGRAVQMWQQLQTNFGDYQAHERFIYFCQKQQLLDYAARQYRLYLEAHPDDAIALKSQQQVKAASMFALTPKSAEKPAKVGFIKRMFSPSYLMIQIALSLYLLGLWDTEKNRWALILSIIMWIALIAHFGNKMYQKHKMTSGQ